MVAVATDLLVAEGVVESLRARQSQHDVLAKWAHAMR